MNDTVASAKAAREALARALALLQSPDAGDLIDSVAQPVASSMGILHQLEQNNGSDAVDELTRVRAAIKEALRLMMNDQRQVPVFDDIAADVAESLCRVHALVRFTSGLSNELRVFGAEQARPHTAQLNQSETAALQTQAEVASTPDLSREKMEADAAQVAALAAAQEQQEAADRAARLAAEQASEAAKAAEAAQAAAALAAERAAADQAAAAAKLAAAQQAAAAQQMAHEQEAQALQDAAQAQALQDAAQAQALQDAAQAAEKQSEPRPEAGALEVNPHRSSLRAALPSQAAPEGAPLIEASLGAHSPSNFYKGLSGNDIVDDGGLFIASYKIPPIGDEIWVHVNLPGGYEFEALALVRWSRANGVGDAPPGFGVAFQSVSDEARKLIYRYTKNREPLFYDDL